MALIRKIICSILLIVDVAAFLYLAVMSKYIVQVDAGTGIVRDGFGRVLERAPIIFWYVFDEWAGLQWFAVDSVVAIVLILLGYLFYNGIIKK